jgi:hypothetical protein
MMFGKNLDIYGFRINNANQDIRAESQEPRGKNQGNHAIQYCNELVFILTLFILTLGS